MRLRKHPFSLLLTLVPVLSYLCADLSARPADQNSSADFQTVCNSPGVIKCVSFDSPADIAGKDGDVSGIEPGDSTPEIDSTVFSSGSGSLKFTVPSNSNANSSGNYFTNFSNDLATQFGENSEFYIQWRQRFSPEFLNTAFAGGNGWKQNIIGTGDQPGKTYYACTDLEVVTQNTYYHGFAQMYDSCSGSTSHQAFDDFYVHMSNGDVNLENGRPSPYCLYSQTRTNPPSTFPPNGNCLAYFPNEWMTFQVHITTGPRVNDEFTNSHIQLWIAREGQPGQLALDFGPYNLTAGDPRLNERFGKLWLLPYNTNKDSSVSNPVAYTWYDDLVISNQPIAMINSAADTNPPTVSMTSPANNAAVSGTITVTATASDDVGVASVQFLLDGANLGAADTAAPYSISWDTTTASNGSHTLAALAEDAAGNRTTSTAITVSVNNAPPDTTAPTVSMTSPANGAAVTGTVTVSANASDNVGVAGVQFILDGANFGSEIRTAPYSISWNTTTASNGSHTLAAIARDAAGNRTTSGAITASVNNTPPDTTAPTVSMTSPANGAAVTATVTVSASASDNVGVAGVQFMLDGAAFGSEIRTAPYSASWNTAAASNGSHTLAAIARDAAGNRTTSGAITVSVNNTPPDTTPPTVSMTSPSNGATVTGTLTVSASASDNVGVAGVQFMLDGAAFGSEIRTAPYSIPWNTASASGGSHTIKAVARDAAGNLSSATVNVTVFRDTTPPSVSITSPSNLSIVTGNVTVSAAASDNVGVVGVQFKLDGVNLGAEVTTAPYSINWNTATASNLTHTLTAVARDAAGNSKTSLADTVTVANLP